MPTLITPPISFLNLKGSVDFLHILPIVLMCDFWLCPELKKRTRDTSFWTDEDSFKAVNTTLIISTKEKNGLGYVIINWVRNVFPKWRKRIMLN